MRDSRDRILPDGNRQYLITNMAKDNNFTVAEKDKLTFFSFKC